MIKFPKFYYFLDSYFNTPKNDCMLRKYYSKNNHLQPFFEEVNKYVDLIYNPNNGMNSEDITSLQSELNIQIPDIYRLSPSM